MLHSFERVHKMTAELVMALQRSSPDPGFHASIGFTCRDFDDSTYSRVAQPLKGAHEPAQAPITFLWTRSWGK